MAQLQSCFEVPGDARRLDLHIDPANLPASSGVVLVTLSQRDDDDDCSWGRRIVLRWQRRQALALGSSTGCSAPAAAVALMGDDGTQAGCDEASRPPASSLLPSGVEMACMALLLLSAARDPKGTLKALPAAAGEGQRGTSPHGSYDHAVFLDTSLSLAVLDDGLLDIPAY